jgi:hypothetical protein
LGISFINLNKKIEDFISLEYYSEVVLKFNVIYKIHLRLQYLKNTKKIIIATSNQILSIYKSTILVTAAPSD